MRRPKVPEAGRQPKGLGHPLQAQHMSAFFSRHVRGVRATRGFPSRALWWLPWLTLARQTPPARTAISACKGRQGGKVPPPEHSLRSEGGGDAICISLNIEGARRPSIRSAIITSVGWPTIRTRETFAWVVVYSHNLAPGHCRMDFSGTWYFLVSQSAHSFADKLFLL